MNFMLGRSVLFLDTFTHGNYDTDIQCAVNFNMLTPAPWSGQVSTLCEDLDALK